MAPKSPWKTTTPKDNKKTNNQKPLLANAIAAARDDTLGSIDYAEVQADEVEALQAIFMDDYEQVEVKSAWSKNNDKAFKLTLKSSTDEKTRVILSVKLTATYPKTPPVLHVEGLSHLNTTARNEIQKILHNRPGELSGEAMVHEIATDIQDVLEDAVQSREHGALPSLEDERMIQETAAEKFAKEAEASEEKRTEDAKAERDREMKLLVEQELERKDKCSRPVRSSEAQSPVNDSTSSSDTVQFDQTITIGQRADSAAFNTVTLVSAISSRESGGVFAAKPNIPGHSIVNAELLAVRQVRLTSSSGDSSNWPNLLELEEVLEQLKKLRIPDIVNIYAFKIEKVEPQGDVASQDRMVTVLTDFANRGSLTELLDDGQVIPLPKARQWSLNLIESVYFYHRNGVAHKRIHAGNVLFCKSASGAIVPKLADAGYEECLLRLQGRSSANDKGKGISWLAPETVAEKPLQTRRSDIWDFGVLLIQMLFGLSITRKHPSPSALLDSLDLSEPLEAVLSSVFTKDPKERPTAFDLMPCEFFRTDVPIMSDEHSISAHGRRQSSSYGFQGQKGPFVRRSRQNSIGTIETPFVSRYMTDFVQYERLGKGGFGQVFKARNRVDNGLYAVKIIKHASVKELQQVLSEAILLHRLNNPYVVRYYSAWIEEDPSNLPDDDEDSMSEAESSIISTDPDIDYGQGNRALDFASSQGYIKFSNNISEDENPKHGGKDEDGDEDHDDTESGIETDDDEDHDDTESGIETDGDQGEKELSLPRTSSEKAIEASQPTRSSELQRIQSASLRLSRSILYIQMEYCEGETLRTLIYKDMFFWEKPQQAWQMLRQILEGLAHIHGHGIIHRDLKPDNVFIDVAGNPRIGDFGLATTGRQPGAGNIFESTTGGDMTKSIGTALYVAPEINSGAGEYNDKVDMYSLGIIFFEMCYPLKTLMERHEVLSKIRERDHVLPPTFQEPEKALQADVILSLIKHSPSERPGSGELLRSGKLPVQLEDETIRQTLQSMVDSRSPYYQKIMTTLFSQTQDQRIKGLAWDARTREYYPSDEEIRVRAIAREIIHGILRQHGAEEKERPMIFDRSSYYGHPDVVQLLDQTGNLLQLPYDLTLPHAKQLAKRAPERQVDRSFVFGHVYRDNLSGGPPRTIGIIDFDVVSQNPRNLSQHEAECMKAVEQIVDAIPALTSATMSFHINHSDLLELILDYCRIDKAQRPAVKETLSKLNFGGNTWAKIRAELRSPLLGIPSTSVDELVQFDFIETPQKIKERFSSIFEGSRYANRVRQPLEQISRTIEQMKLLNVQRKVYISPLSCINEKFYTNGILFQCINDTKQSKAVFAAGGRYDKLIEAHQPRDAPASSQCHAVGVSLVWDGLVRSIMRRRKSSSSNAFLKKEAKEAIPAAGTAQRCEVLVASADQTLLETKGISLLPILWDAKFSAELATDTGVVDDLLSRQLETSHSWVVVVKHDASTIKVWSKFSGVTTEVAPTNLMHHLRAELREKEHELGNKHSRHPALMVRHLSHHAAGNEKAKGRSDVRVLLAQHKSKKSNKFSIVGNARDRWHACLRELQNSAILAVETRDDVLESISRETRLSDGDTWRKVIQGVSVNERQYLSQVLNELSDMKTRWEGGEGERVVGLYNFRSGACVYYDLAA